MCVITEKKLQLNIARLCRHNFLSLVVFWFGGGGGPPGPPPGYAYAPQVFYDNFWSNRSVVSIYTKIIITIRFAFHTRK